MNEALVKKLRLTPDMNALVLLTPDDSLFGEIGLRPEASVFDPSLSGAYDFVQLFVKSVAELNETGPAAMNAVKPDGLFWICYPKPVRSGRIDRSGGFCRRIGRHTGSGFVLRSIGSVRPERVHPLDQRRQARKKLV
jgi:hypothetical protein